MNKLQKLLKKQWFTLVELIIVIAIIAVLAVAAFMMLTKWLWKSRDSRRLSDLWTIQKWLEVWYADSDMWNGQYPDISEQTGAVLLYSGTEDKMLAYQGIVNLEVSKLANLQKTPLDPSDKNEYTYSVTANRKKFQLLAMLEDGSEVTAIVNQAYALDYKNREATVRGFELGILLEEGTNLPIQYSESNMTWLDLSSALTGYIAKVKDGEDPVVWSGIQELEIYTQGTVTSENDEEEEEENSTPTVTVTQTDCENVGWDWISSTDDVYIWTSQGDGFCISPTVDFSDTSDGLGWISWNGWWYNSPSVTYNGWDGTDNLSTDIRDTQELYTGKYGQTRTLNNPSNYTCESIWDALKWFTTGTTVWVTDGTDTVLNRMRYIAVNKNSHTNMTHNNIDWVDFGEDVPVNNHAIPAIFMADCIDGMKDLWTDMTVYYKLNDDTTDVVTYADYSANETTTSTDTVQLSNTIYQDRQKYLLWWTQKSGSHLPSAYSYIESGTPGGCSGTSCDNLTTTARGEYQVACDSKHTVSDSTFYYDWDISKDRQDGERIWLSSIGNTTGSIWGRSARLVGYNGCGAQNDGGTGYRDGNASARFVVR